MKIRRPKKTARDKRGETPHLPTILCPRCDAPIVRGQHVPPLFAARIVKWSEHPVLSKPMMLRGLIHADGGPGRRDFSLGEQLRQRVAMGGAKERAELEAVQKFLAESLANAIASRVREEAAAAGVDVWTWLARKTDQDEA